MSDEPKRKIEPEPAANPTPADPPRTPPQPCKLFRSAELFEGEQMICIEHDGAIYRLQITARGRLILQK